MWMQKAAIALVALGLASCSSMPWQEEEPQRADEGVVGKPGTSWPAPDEFEASGGYTPEISDTPWPEARARGAEIRAIGQEPGWWLEIRRGGRVMRAREYGTRRQVVDRPPAEPLEDGGERFHVAQAGITITVRELFCEDIMSGEAMPLTVEVLTPDETLQGCGRRLGEGEHAG